jgi:hypothetical protein
MNDDKTIFGETTMTWGDQARLSIRPLARGMAIFIVLAIVAFLITWAIAVSDGEWLLLRHDPIDALGGFVHDVWPVLLTCVLVMLILMTGLYARAFYRFPDANRRIIYEATKDHLTTRDAANFAFTMPWSMVVRVRNSGATMRMQLSAGIWRTVFLRAFAPEDREQILRWAQHRDVDQPRR